MDGHQHRQGQAEGRTEYAMFKYGDSIDVTNQVIKITGG